jgi:hypothetical protein
MVMQTPTIQHPELVQAERDMVIRRSGGLEETRALLSYDEVSEMRESGQGSQLRRFGIVMRGPDRKGEPGAGAVVALPAEKFQKWFGQGYRPTKSVEDHELIEYPEPPEPQMWLPSMVEDAIGRGEAIPEELAPVGYMGEMFSLKERREARDASAVALTAESKSSARSKGVSKASRRAKS